MNKLGFWTTLVRPVITMARLSLLCLFLASCGLIGSSEKCDPGFNEVAESASISFELLDARTFQNLLYARAGIYSPDSVKVFNSARYPVFKGPVGGDGRVGFNPLSLEVNRLPYDTDLTRNYFLYLNRADQDTFALSFRLRKNGCGFAEFERYSLRYNGKEVATGQGLTIPSLTLYKR